MDGFSVDKVEIGMKQISISMGFDITINNNGKQN